MRDPINHPKLVPEVSSPPEKPSNPAPSAAPPASAPALDRLTTPQRTPVSKHQRCQAQRAMLKAIAKGDADTVRNEWDTYTDAGFRGEDAIRAAMHLKQPDLVPIFLQCGGQATELLSTELLPFIGYSTFETLVALVTAGAPVNNSDGTSKPLEAVVDAFLHHEYDRGEMAKGFGKSQGVPSFNCRTLHYLLVRGARLSRSDNIASASFIEQCKDEKQPITPALSELLNIFNNYGAKIPLRQLEHFVYSDIIFSNLRKTPSAILEQAIIEADLPTVQRVMHEEPSAISQVSSPLNLAIRSRSTEMVTYLLKQNLKVDEYVWEELLACEQNRGGDFQLEVATHLLESSPNIATKRGAPFIAASRLGNPDIFDLFLKKARQLDTTFPRDLALGTILVEVNRQLNPGTSLFPIVKKLIQQGADPSSALLLAQAPSCQIDALSLYKDPELKMSFDADYYTNWISAIEHERAHPDRVRQLLHVVPENKILENLIDVLFQMANLVKFGPEIDQVGFANKSPTRHAVLIAQVFDPNSSCFFNQLVPEGCQLEQDRINPMDLRQNRNYQMISDVAAFATVMYPPSSLRERFITLVKKTFADTPREADRQARIESIFDIIPKVRALVVQFASYVLLPALIRKSTADAYGSIHVNLRDRFMRPELEGLAAEVLFDGRSLQEIKELTKRWEKVKSRHPIPIRMSTSWPPILDQPLDLGDGFNVEEITNCRGLREIGKEMGNCLETGIHAPECYYGISRILVIFKSSDGVNQPTIAMTLQNKQNEWRITEYEGAHYIPVDESPGAPLTKFREMLSSKQVNLKDAPRLTIEDIEQHTDNLSQLKEFYHDEDFLEALFDTPLIEPGMDAEAFFRIGVETAHHGGTQGDQPMKLLSSERVERYHARLNEIHQALEAYREFQAMLEARDTGL